MIKYLAILFATCVALSLNAHAAKPSSKEDPNWVHGKKGNLEFLYTLDSNTVKSYFPVGVSRKQINERYGTGFSALFEMPTSKLNSDKYDFVNSFSNINSSESFSVISSVEVFYDKNNKVTNANLEHLVSYWDGSKLKDMAEVEARQFLAEVKQMEVPVFEKEKEEPKKIIATKKTNNLNQSNNSIQEKKWKLGLKLEDNSTSKKGALVASVNPDGLAGEAGIKINDLITHLNDEEINSKFDVANFLEEHPIEEEIVVKVFRSGKVKTITIRTTDKSPII